MTKLIVVFRNFANAPKNGLALPGLVMRPNALPNFLHILIYVLHMERKTLSSTMHWLKNPINVEDKFRSSGVYPQTFPVIKVKYMGQTGSCFETRIKNTYFDLRKIIISLNSPSHT
jgi:hypothetical protein